jgi:DNA-binding beta-propeller fold protein YncE
MRLTTLSFPTPVRNRTAAGIMSALLFMPAALLLPLAGLAQMAPRFEVDPFWPQPLPNHWLLGSAIGVSVDADDHVWVIHRPGSLVANELGGGSAGEGCCAAAPDVLEFDQRGTLVSFWGGPGEGYEWPQSNHGITVDHENNVWLGGNGANDAQILKFTRTGDFLMQLGNQGGNRGSNDPENYGQVAKISIDPAAGEAFIADGYGNKRVAVIDTDTGEFKRYWGAYGNRPDDTPPGPYDPEAPLAMQFRNPVHCAEPSRDGLVYVCDRLNDRIQVFRKDGAFVNELQIAPGTLGNGSVWDIAFSPDPEQTWMYVADGSNERIWILDRKSMTILTSFGAGGRQPGQFYGVHSIATDSQGNLYTTETFEGKRVQKFVFRGLAPVTTEYQGTVWPAGE